MAGPRASLKIHGPGAGRVEQAIGTLYAIETAYNNLYVANVHIDAIYDLLNGKNRYPAPFPFIWPHTIATSYLYGEDFRRIIQTEDVLELGIVQFESPGFWEFLGALNPLEQIRQYLNDRHERKKDNEFRNRAEEKKLELENERLAAQVFSERVDGLAKAGFSNEDIRRIILPSARALNSVANAQDNGLIEFAELKRIEDEGSNTN